jgi:hypothetical protein
MGPGKINPKFLESFLSLKNFLSEESFLRRKLLKKRILKKFSLKRRRKFFKVYRKPLFI